MPQEGLIKAVRLKSTIVIPFPNYEICPKYIYKNYRFGIGDGVKTNFSSIILNEIVVNESTLNINEFSYGLLSDNPENNVYFQNADYTKSPLYNQAKYIQICFNDKPAINNKHFIIAELQPLTDDSVPISTKDFPITSSFEIPMCDILYT